jgi:RNA polymerase sigma-70 factor (ECF subfamily)
LSLLKKDAKHKGNTTDDIPDEVIEDSRVFDDDSLNLLYAAIKRLSEIDRAVILLYLEGNSYQEIAEIIGSNQNNIGVRINRIKERLKKLLDGKVN